MTAIKLWVYPELNRIPEQERGKALAQANDLPFDGIELGGMAVGLVMATALTRFVLPETFVQYVAATIAGFIAALAILLVFVGPFYIRRTRRGLHAYLLKTNRDRLSGR